MRAPRGCPRLAQLMSEGLKSSWDKMWNMTETVEALSPTTSIIRDEYKPLWPTGARDFVLLREVEEQADGAWAVGACSVTDPRAPEKKGLVRAECLIGGFVLRPDPSSPNSTLMSYITAVDLKGSIPEFIINQVAVDQPLCVARVAEVAMTRPLAAPSSSRQPSSSSLSSSAPSSGHAPLQVRGLEPVAEAPTQQEPVSIVVGGGRGRSGSRVKHGRGLHAPVCGGGQGELAEATRGCRRRRGERLAGPEPQGRGRHLEEENGQQPRTHDHASARARNARYTLGTLRRLLSHLLGTLRHLQFESPVQESSRRSPVSATSTPSTSRQRRGCYFIFVQLACTA